MTETVFLVLLLTAYWIKTRSIEAAALDIYLPVFLLIPAYYGYRLPHLPNIFYSAAALIPISLALLASRWKEWKFTRSDLWIALYFGGAALTEVIHSDNGTAGLILFDGLFQGVLPYILGKMLLETPGLREKFVRRWVYITAFIAVPTMWEYRMGRNLFTTVEGMIFGAVSGIQPIRGGHVRAAATFTGPIQAGCMFAAAFVMCLWIGLVDQEKGGEPKYWGVRRSTLLMIAMCAGMFMANSRGPEIGALLGFLIARIGKSKNFRLSLIMTLALMVVGGGAGYLKAKTYTSGSLYDAKDHDQENAIYRRLLLDEYKPYLDAGGLLGYGVIQRPVVPGMFSIDNAFMNIQLIQGNLGLWTFILMGAEGVIASFRAARRATQRQDICFAMCMCGVITGLFLTLTTVYLSAPMYSLFFLLVGWSQSLRQTEAARAAVPQAVNARFAFRRVVA